MTNKQLLTLSMIALAVPAGKAAAAPVAEQGDGFGVSATSGDFNGDGFIDTAIGVYGQMVNGVMYAGAVDIFYGTSAGPSTVPFVLTQDGTGDDVAASDRFGEVLAAGDFNNDTFSDLVVGLPREDKGTKVDSGIVQVFAGSMAGLVASSNQLWQQGAGSVGTIEGSNTAGDLFGSSLAVGDFDGDLVDDLAVGSPGESVGSLARAGATSVIYGLAGTGLAAARNKMFHQETTGIDGNAEAGDACGFSLAAGDFNFDLRDDLAIGCPGEGTTTSSASSFGDGAVHVLYGAATTGLKALNSQLWYEGVLGLPARTWPGEHFGNALATGDFDGDNRDDLAVGIPMMRVTGTVSGVAKTWDFAGGVQIIYGVGGTGLNGARTFLLTEYKMGETVNDAGRGDMFGSRLATGYMDAGAFADLLVGAPDESLTTTIYDSGKVFAVYGASAGITAAAHKMWHRNLRNVLGDCAAQDAFGWALTVADINNDTLDDAVITAPNATNAGGVQFTGNASLLRGSATGLTEVGNSLLSE